MEMPRLIAFDVDGTIAGADDRPTTRTVETLRRLADVGIAGVIVTGRSERSARRLAQRLAFTAPQVSCNGALVTLPTTGERLWLRQLDPSAAARAVAAGRAVGGAPTVWTADAWYVEADTPSSRLLTRLLDEAPIVEPLDQVIAREQVVKVMIGGEPDLLDAATPELQGVITGMERSMDVFFEAAPVGATKQEAVAFLLDYLGLEAAAAWGFGDGGNDVGWLQLMGRALAPANARPTVQAIADEVIGHHADDSVAVYLEYSVFGNLKP